MPRGRGYKRNPSEKLAITDDVKNRLTLSTIWPEDDLCPLCKRPLIPGPSVNDHHLVPRSQGGKQKFAMHRVCHSKIHSVFSEHDLAMHYNTFPKLRAHPDLKKFIKWISKQSTEVNFKNKKQKH